jgi:hypothetical protein
MYNILCAFEGGLQLLLTSMCILHTAHCQHQNLSCKVRLLGVAAGISTGCCGWAGWAPDRRACPRCMEINAENGMSCARNAQWKPGVRPNNKPPPLMLHTVQAAHVCLASIQTTSKHAKQHDKLQKL